MGTSRISLPLSVYAADGDGVEAAAPQHSIVVFGFITSGCGSFVRDRKRKEVDPKTLLCRE